MKDITLAVLAGLCACLLFTTGYFAIEASNNKKPAPFVKLTNKSSQQRVENFFAYRTKSKVLFNTYFWKIKVGKKIYVTTENEIFYNYGLNSPEQQKDFRVKFAKQGNKRYIRTCYRLDAKDTSWSFGYCVDNPARIQDVQG